MLCMYDAARAATLLTYAAASFSPAQLYLNRAIKYLQALPLPPSRVLIVHSIPTQPTPLPTPHYSAMESSTPHSLRRRGSLSLSQTLSLDWASQAPPADLEQIHASSSQAPGLTSFSLGSPPSRPSNDQLSLNKLYWLTGRSSCHCRPFQRQWSG